MTTPTSVGRRRRARLAVLALTTSVASMASMPAAASDVIPPRVDTMSPTGVSIADGTFIYTETDLSIGTLQLERFHSYTSSNPVDPAPKYSGPHASNNFDIYVSPNWIAPVYRNDDGPPVGDEDPKPVMLFPQHYRPIVHLGLGASGEYRQDYNFTNPAILPNSTEANRAELKFVNGHYVYTDQGGTIYTFSAAPNASPPASLAQRVTSIAFPDGLIRTFSYDSSSRLKMVKDSTGYAILFDWGSSGITAACGFDLSRNYVDAASTCTSAPYKVTYAYTNGALSSSTNAAGEVTNYTDVVGCIRPPGYTTCKVQNVWGDRQLTQTLADGSVWHFHWSIPAIRDSDYLPTDGDNEVSVTDGKGNTSNYVFTGTTLVSATDANQHTTEYMYDGSWGFEQTYFYPALHTGSMLKQAIMPEGNAYHAEYNGAFGAISRESVTPKPGSGESEQVVTYGYTCTSGAPVPGCAKPTSRTDARNDTANWSYTSFGEPAWEMQPAPSTGAARPLKLYTYVQKYAYVLDASSTLTASPTPVWLPASETLCQTVTNSSTPTCDPAAQQTVTTYEYGADGTAGNLLLRGLVVTADGQSRRTCVAYDPQGNKIAETKARAGLTSCP